MSAPKHKDHLRRRVARAVKNVVLPDKKRDPKLEALITVGRHTYPARPNVVNFGTYGTRLTIGAFCSIATGNFFLDCEHRIDWVTTFPVRIEMGLPGAWEDGHPTTRGDIIVGNDVWIGSDAVILSGVTIGDGAVIGADAVVSTDVPPYGIAVGNPATTIRKRFTDDQIAALLRIKWWDWTDAQITERVGDLCNPDIDAFIKKYDTAS
jgi:chloramphenicol O-acetyltransferase type B